MSFAVVGSFHKSLKNVLQEHDNMRKEIREIYLSPEYNCSYPSIFINLVEIVDQSELSLESYLIKVKVCLFVREKDYVVPLTVMDTVKKAFGAMCVTSCGEKASGDAGQDRFDIGEILSGNEFEVIRFRMNSITLDVAHDLVSTKVEAICDFVINTKV